MNTNNLKPYLIRETMLKAAREFFYARGFHEVIPTIFNDSVPLEPNIYPFKTTWEVRGSGKTLYLTTSPERSIKRMLARGLERVFSIGKCMRNLEGAGSKHMPEYLMLEWYRSNAQFTDIITDLEAFIMTLKHAVDMYNGEENNTLLQYNGQTIDLKPPWATFSLNKLFKEKVGIELKKACSDEEYFFACARKRGYTTQKATWNELFDQLFVQEIESTLPLRPYILTDFPARLSPLCEIKKDEPYLAERFEFFIAGMEIANGNNENTDVTAIRARFTEENANRIKAGKDPLPVDEEFLAALLAMAKTGAAYAGIGLGIDRLAMLFSGVSAVNEVELLSVYHKL